MPDFDVDFCYNRRDEVIDYVARRYGRERVSQIITFGTLAARAAIRDVGRAMGMAYRDVDTVARAVPHELGITLPEALRLPDLKTLYDGSEQVRRLVDTAIALEGMPRNISIHAAGVVITERPVAEYVPLAVSGGTVVTQFDMDTVARLGVLKFDFLALRYRLSCTMPRYRSASPIRTFPWNVFRWTTPPFTTCWGAARPPACSSWSPAA